MSFSVRCNFYLINCLSNMFPERLNEYQTVKDKLFRDNSALKMKFFGQLPRNSKTCKIYTTPPL